MRTVAELSIWLVAVLFGVVVSVPVVNGVAEATRTLVDDCGVTGGCATLDTCNDDGYDTACAQPTAYVCEHELPGLSVCASPPLAAMLPCWMSSLNDTLSLNEISIPGTHNTMAKGLSACFQDGIANHVHTQVRDMLIVP